MLFRINILLFSNKATGESLTPGGQPAFAKKLRCLFLFFLQAVCLIAFSQKQHIKFDHLGIAEGLSQSNVLCIMKDSRGFMWFGTWNGLNRYDGYTIRVYKNDPFDQNSISNNFIRSIIESKNGDLWIATAGGGVCRYDRNKEKFTRFMHDPKNENSIVDDVANSLVEDKNGMLWIGTDKGLDKFDPVRNKFEHFIYNPADRNSLGSSTIKYVFEDSRRDLWICTINGGISRLNRKSNNFTSFQHDKKNIRSIGSNDVNTMFEDSKRRLWIGTEGAGMDLFDQKTGIFYHFKHDENNAGSLAGNFVSSINEDAANNLWVGTANGGLCIFNYTAGLFSHYKNDLVDRGSISNNSINAIYRDSKNNMWLGTFAAGVDLANYDKLNFTHYKQTLQKNSLSNNQVLSIFEDSKNNIWIGTDGGGLNLFDPRSGSFTHFRHKKNNKQSICGDYVLTVCEDSKGNIWIGTWADGVTMYNPGNKTFKHFKNDPGNPASLTSNNAWKIFEDSDKNIWVGTSGGGLNLLNPDRNSFTHFQHDNRRHDGISNNTIISIFEDSHGELWICTGGGGLNLYNKKNRTFSRFFHDNTKNSISNNNLSSILEDDNENLWIGTGSGLNQLDRKTHRFTVYTMKDGLPGNEIFGILEDGKKNLWISTNKGISRFNPLMKSFTNFGVADGLQANEFALQAFCKSRSGMMYFGGNNGFNQFFPDSIKAVAFEPPLVITGFQVFNKEVAIAKDKNDPSPLKRSITETKAITLPYSNSVFSFEFATLNYTGSEKKRYAYMLEDFDNDWNEAGTQRTATYTNLDPGKYLFKVKGLNNEGNWSSNITSIQLTITPPFWLTWWFRLFVLASIAGVVFAFYRFRVNIIESQKRKLQYKVKEQTWQLLQSTEVEHKARKEAEQANIELERKNTELEQFAYVASHDLQEPLRTTSGFAELLQQQYKGRLDEKADTYLTFLTQSSERMMVLIKDLLDYSRIGKKMEWERVDCNIILQEVLADLDLVIKETEAEINVDPLPVIDGYPTEIKQLFQNLLINAIKFRKAHTSPQIKIAACPKNGYWEFTCMDNGIGINKQHRERIFIIFQRLHTRSKYAGSGIGLAHCKKIVELHGGKIWMESIHGEGSTFHFTILKNGNL